MPFKYICDLTEDIVILEELADSTQAPWSPVPGPALCAICNQIKLEVYGRPEGQGEDGTRVCKDDIMAMRGRYLI